MDVSFKEQGVAFKMDDSLQAPPVPFDPGQMRQVLINIFKNALEAMPQGGRLSVSLEIRGGDLFLLVADTGQGIAPEHLPDLFTPFFTTKEKGTGLGLSICRHLIEQHQGEIRITSEVNRGTTCTIRLPLSSA
jgi:signal transduction histidine kinase